MANTKIVYLYRDQCGYKKFNSAIVRGEISPAEISIIINCLHEGECFIPGDVGLPEIRIDGRITEDDHIWFELSESDFALTTEEPDTNYTAADLVANFVAHKNNWDEKSATTRMYMSPNY